jgi:hypothetical protein
MKCFEKRFLMVLVVFVFLFSSLSFVFASTVDKEGPVLKSISVVNSNKKYSNGDKVYLKIDANDAVSGISSISVGVTKVDGNESAGFTAEVYDFDTKPYIIVDESAVTGKWEIDQVQLYDNSGNDTSYINKKDVSSFKYLGFKASFSVVSSGVDKTAPVLDSIKLSKSSVNFGESVGIVVKAHDDLSGIKNVEVSFYRDGDNKMTWGQILKYDSKSKAYVGEFDVPLFSDNYHIDCVTLVDNASNSEAYGRVLNVSKKGDYYTYNDKLGIKNLGFKVNGSSDNTDSYKVEITEMKYEYKKLVAPSVYEMKLKVSDNTKLIDRADITIYKNDNTSKGYQMFLEMDSNGYLSGSLDINQFMEPGAYYIKKISLYNSKDLKANVIEKINSSLKYDKVKIFELSDNNFYDIVSSTTDKDLIKKIKESDDTAKIAISSSNSTLVSKDVFEAIMNTNRIVYIESNGIQWVFSGKNITNPKDIDVNTSIAYVYNDELYDVIGDYVENGIVVHFADNGELPGLARIRVKTDYVLRDYLGSNVSVYLYNKNDSYLFDSIAFNVSANDNGYFEFITNHNSMYVLSNRVIDEKVVSSDDSILKLNDSKVNDVANLKVDDNKGIILSICAILVAIAGVIAIVIVKRHKEKKNLGAVMK